MRVLSASIPAVLVLGSFIGCGDNGTNMSMDMAVQVSDMGKDMGAGGGPVTGAQDTHCQGDGGLMANPTSQSSCHPDAMAGMADYGDTMNNASGYDDDCKYQVSFTVNPVFENQDVTFTVTAKNSTDNSAVTGAKIRAEVFLSDTHPAPNSGVMTTEMTGGVYKITPVRFDASGKWTVRFHLFEDCSDALDDSPHGHAAFFINVP